MALSYKPNNAHLDDETPLPPALSIDNGSINDNDDAEAADVVPTKPWYKQTRVHIAFLSIWAMALIIAAATIFRPGGPGNNEASVFQSSQATSITSDNIEPTFFPTFYPTISPVVSAVVEEVTVNKDPPAMEEEIVIEEVDDSEEEMTVTVPTPTAKPTFDFKFPDSFNTPTPPPVTTGFPTTYMPTNQQTVTVSTEITSGATMPCREGEDCFD